MDDSSADDIVDRTPQTLSDSPAHADDDYEEPDRTSDGDSQTSLSPSADSEQDDLLKSLIESMTHSEGGESDSGPGKLISSFLKLLINSGEEGDAEDSDQASYTDSSSQSADDEEQQQLHDHRGENGKVYLR